MGCPNCAVNPYLGCCVPAPRYSYAELVGLGQLPGDDLAPGGVEDCPPGWPPGVPCVFNPDIGTWQIPGMPSGQAPPGIPAPLPGPAVIITEDEARRREAEAFERGADAERANLITYSVIGAVASGLVGVGLGYLFR